MKRTAIVIPTYNHIEDCLKSCISSIADYTDLNDKTGAIVIVVANGCTDNTPNYLRGLASIYPWLFFVIVDEQLGYTKATNIGIMRAMEFKDVDRILLLNNDVVLLPQHRNHWIELLESGFTDDKVAVTGTVLKLEEVVRLPFIIFFCAMIRRSVIEEIGMLDEAFSPGFGEDVDFCTRAICQGYTIRQVPVDMPPELQNGQYVCHFPLYHAGTKSFKEYDGYSEVVNRNIQRLKDKYINDVKPG